MRRKTARRLLTVAVAGAVVAAFVVVTRVASAEVEFTARFDYSMPDRVVMDPLAPGSVQTVTPSRKFLLQEDGWEVDLDGCASRDPDHIIVRYTWKIDMGDGNIVEKPSTGCQESVTFPDLGKYPTELTVTDINGLTATTTRSIVVRDIVVVSMGDSLASGEGNPDHVSLGVGPGGWKSRQCHRSGRSGPALAARRLEEADPHSSVTFLSVACSGASIVKGILGEYQGQEFRSGDNVLDPQIVQVNRLLCKTSEDGCADKKETRRIDALLLQVGANDLHFGDVVRECGFPRLAGLFEFCHTKDETLLRLFNDMKELPGRYAELASRLDSELNYNKAFLPEYFDPTSNDDGRLCPSMAFKADDSPDGEITQAEAKWAFEEVISPLNHEVRAAGEAANNEGHRWKIVTGTADAFAQHGYCAQDHWVIQYHESFQNQGGEDGTMHPNRDGHKVYTDFLSQAMQPLLEPGTPPSIELPPDVGGDGQPGGGIPPGGGGEVPPVGGGGRR
jgi:hypothetical protein